MTEKQIGTHPPYAQFAVAVQRGSMMGSGEGRGPRKGSKPSDHSGNARHGMGPSTGGERGSPLGHRSGVLGGGEDAAAAAVVVWNRARGERPGNSRRRTEDGGAMLFATGGQPCSVSMALFSFIFTNWITANFARAILPAVGRKIIRKDIFRY